MVRGDEMSGQAEVLMSALEYIESNLASEISVQSMQGFSSANVLKNTVSNTIMSSSGNESFQMIIKET